MTVPEAAVQAAADWLPHAGDCEVRPGRDCTCRKPRVELMRAALEAAAPPLQAAAWLEGMNHALSWFGQRECATVMAADNPYGKGT